MGQLKGVQWMVKLLLRLCYIAIGGIALFIGLLHLPFVQQRLLNSVLRNIAQTTRYHINCAAVWVTGMGNVTLEGIEITDLQKRRVCSLQQCKVKLNLWHLLLHRLTVLDSLMVKQARLYLEGDQSIINLYHNFILPLVSVPTRDITIRAVQLVDCNLYYYSSSRLKTISIAGLHLVARNLLFATDRYTGTIVACGYKRVEGLPFVLQKMGLRYTITPYSILLKECQWVTHHSHIRGDFQLQHSKQLPLLIDRDKLVLEAKLKESVLAPVELGHYADFLGATAYKLHGLISLTADRVVWKDCKLAFGESYVATAGSWTKDDSKPSVDLFIQEGMVYTKDLPAHLTKAWHAYLAVLPYVVCKNITFKAKDQAIQWQGDIFSAIGHIKPTLTITNWNKKDITYQGSVIFHKLAVQSLLPRLPITALSGVVEVQGRGAHPAHMHICAMARMQSIESHGYCYKHIEASCSGGIRGLDFAIKSADPNVALTLTGNYCHRSKCNLQLQGVVTKCNLNKLGCVAFPYGVHAKFSLRVRDIFNSFPKGRLVLEECGIKHWNKQIMYKSVVIETTQQPSRHNRLTLTAPFIDCCFQGDYTLLGIRRHLQHLITQRNHTDILPPPCTRPCRIDYAVHCKELAPLLDFFWEGLYIAPTATFMGQAAYAEGYHFSCHGVALSTIRYKNASLKQVKIDLSIRDLIHPIKRSVTLSISSAEQAWHKKYTTNQLSFHGWMKGNQFRWAYNLSFPYYQSNMSINGSGLLYKNGLSVILAPSHLQIGEKKWSIQAEMPSTITKHAISIGNIFIKTGDESIFIGGSISKLPSHAALRCEIRNLICDMLIKTIRYSGKIDATLVERAPKGHLRAALTLKDFMLSDYLIGTLTTTVDWLMEENKLVVTGLLQKATQWLATIRGHYDLQKDGLAMTVKCNKMHLDPLRLWTAPICSEIVGKLTGKFFLTGSLRKPTVKGAGRVDQGLFKIDYLNTRYHLTSSIKVHQNTLYMDQLYMHDAQVGYATLSGHIAFQPKLTFMLSGKVNDFHLLDTASAAHTNFYGNLYATGKLQIQGAIDDTIISMHGVANKGNITIVSQEEDGTMEHNTQLIQFRYLNKPPSKKLAEEKPPSAIKLIVDLHIRPSVKAKVLFDSHSSKNSIEGRGEGNIQLEVGTHQKPYLIGSYHFHGGNCTISVYNLTQKTFEIMSGSHIIFNGYPQEGVVHIRARYTQMASIAGIKANTEDKRAIPVEITLAAYGRLSSPHISYGIAFPVKPIDTALQTVLDECAARILLDRSYAHKQILSVLIAKSVCHESNITGWDALNSTISDWVTHRLSAIDPNLSIETDFHIHQWNRASEEAQKSRITVRYRLFSERLKLSTTLGRHSYLLNDWELAYRMAQHHDVSIKLYYQPLEDRTPGGLSGISLSYTKKFR